MKNIKFLLIVSLVALFSCKAVTDDEIIMYDGVNRVQFDDDSVKINIATMVVNDVYEIRIPVSLMGNVDYVNDRIFALETYSDENQDTSFIYAEEGVHFESLSGGFLMEKDSITAGAVIRVIGSTIGTDKPYRINLQIKNNDQFVEGATERLRASITVVNFLEKPEWWDVSGLSSPFEPLMLTKLFEVYGKQPIDDIWDDYMGVFAAISKVSAWLDEHPEYGVQFNAADKEYFKMFV